MALICSCYSKNSGPNPDMIGINPAPPVFINLYAIQSVLIGRILQKIPVRLQDDDTVADKLELPLFRQFGRNPGIFKGFQSPS